MRALLMILVTSIILVSCKRSAANPTPQATNQAVQAPVVEQATPQQASVPREIKYFTGSIGNTQGLKVKLVREGDKLTGSYSYQNVGPSIELKGSVDKDLISIQFDIGTYYSGAAHPNSISQALNFEVEKLRALRLRYVFKPGVKYLEALSSFAIKDLKRQSAAHGPNGLLDDASIESGAGPSVKNFESWTITRKGLGITFDAYQVGPPAGCRPQMSEENRAKAFCCLGTTAKRLRPPAAAFDKFNREAVAPWLRGRPQPLCG